ncbi:nitroreductase [Salinibacterium sp. UTAS2018]|uniref:nitroreductase family protein n=1 Tax=Salinibacterium sp. UTAS2018 TaxID=2508880 RepID=UPI00100973D6|nr:nitroreductase family protein [Salinibacterium sp. UTAS2018]QAV71343.1 nitroreductase [Salinibacterium sp. UTAS2018]
MTVLHDRLAATDSPILDVLAERWSPRHFDATAPLDEAALQNALEAARWAPSAYNSQPWRVVIARRGTAQHEAIVATLSGFNQTWAPSASALIVFVAEHHNEEGRAQAMASYDLGQAVAYFTVQAQSHGLFSHQMSGFDPDAAAAALEIDPRFTPTTVMAVGTLGDPVEMTDVIRERETAPRARRAAAESVLVNA